MNIQKKLRSFSGALKKLRIAKSQISENNDSKPVVFCFRFNDWKHNYLSGMLGDYCLIFVPFAHSAWWWKPLLNSVKNPIFLCWGYKEPQSIGEYAKSRNIPLWRMEDGFIRSIGLGATHSLPVSQVIDKSGTLYFDSRQESGLERIISNLSADKEPELIDRARKAIDIIRSGGISKYNSQTGKSLDEYIPFCDKKAKRILVIGQVEDDASIQFGGQGKTNGQLVWEARKRNPDATILFRPHPDVLAGKRKILTPLSEIENIAHVIKEPMSLATAFDGVDEVYTITSLSGFEALLHGLKVVTLGQPFYAGWGLTEDLTPISRRSTSKTIEELFAAAYIQYPIYINPFSGAKISFEEALALIATGIKHRNERAVHLSVEEPTQILSKAS